MRILGSIVFLVFACIWYLPVYKRLTAAERIEKSCIFKSVLWGLGPAFIIAVVIQMILSAIYYYVLGMDKESLSFSITQSIFSYALIEELVKGFIAYKLYCKSGYESKAACVLIFGAVGLGYGILESLLFIQNIVHALIRSVISLHIFLQFFMGYFFFEAVKCKASGKISDYKKKLATSFFIPFFIHMLHDIAGSFIKILIGDDEAKNTIGYIVILISAAIDIIFIIKTLKLVRSVKEVSTLKTTSEG